MTKKEFAKSILETVDNMDYVGTLEEERIWAIEALLSPLKPKDIKRFAKWGQPDQQSTPEKCWD